MEANGEAQEQRQRQRQMEAQRQIGYLFPNGYNGVNIYFDFGPMPATLRQVDQWPLSQDVTTGWDIRTNPASGAQIHYDWDGRIYRFKMVREGDTSLDGIVTVSQIMEREDPRMDEMFNCTLTVSTCEPVYHVLQDTTHEYYIYTFGYFFNLFRMANAIGRHPICFFQFPNGKSIIANI